MSPRFPSPTSLAMTVEPAGEEEKVTWRARELVLPAMNTRVSKPEEAPFLERGWSSHCRLPSALSKVMPAFSSVFLVAPLMVSCGCGWAPGCSR